MDSKENVYNHHLLTAAATDDYGCEESIKNMIRKGKWTEEEDSLLVQYIQNHGEGHWDFVSRCTGLKRTGKSCRLRWLNYLRPGIRRGNFTLEEQLKILELHILWGNRWSRIAGSLHGRTDNEIKNFWRTRVQKQAKQLNCNVNSKEFRDIIRNVLMPRLAEQIQSKSCHYLSLQKVLFPPISSWCANSGSNDDLVSAVCTNEKALPMGDDISLLEEYTPCQRENELDGADQDVGDDFWNEENVKFLRQELFGDMVSNSP